MQLKCNFGDADKIRKMLSDKYKLAEFKVEEERDQWSSLNRIRIFDRDRLVLILLPSFDGYVIESYDYLYLNFLGDIYECLLNKHKNEDCNSDCEKCPHSYYEDIIGFSEPVLLCNMPQR